MTVYHIYFFLVRGYLQKKINIRKIPYHHPHNFVHGSSLPVYKADCLLFALSCNYIMIYVGSTSSFSQKFTLVFKELGSFVTFYSATKLQSMLISFCHKSWKCCCIGKTFSEESRKMSTWPKIRKVCLIYF